MLIHTAVPPHRNNNMHATEILFKCVTLLVCCCQVSHHPPISVCYAESRNFIFSQDARIKTKFWGKSMEFQPTGNYRCASWKVLMDIFGNEFGHIRAFIGSGRLSIGYKLMNIESGFGSCWGWRCLFLHLCPDWPPVQSLSHASLSLGRKWLVYSANDLFPI